MNEETITGKLTDLTRLPSSRNGNPRWKATVSGVTFSTDPDSSYGYELQNYEDKHITVKVRHLKRFTRLLQILKN